MKSLKETQVVISSGKRKLYVLFASIVIFTEMWLIRSKTKQTKYTQKSLRQVSSVKKTLALLVTHFLSRVVGKINWYKTQVFGRKFWQTHIAIRMFIYFPKHKVVFHYKLKYFKKGHLF